MCMAILGCQAGGTGLHTLSLWMQHRRIRNSYKLLHTMENIIYHTMFTECNVYKQAGHNKLFWRFFHYICQTRIFSIKLQGGIRGAEIQTRNVLTFEIFHLSSFRDMVVQSRSGLTLKKSTNAGHNEPVVFRPQNLAEF